MSLVGEALKKARQEGRIKEGRRFLPTVFLGGDGGRRGVSLPLVLALVFAAAGLGGSIAWVLLTRPLRTGPASEARRDEPGPDRVAETGAATGPVAAVAGREPDARVPTSGPEASATEPDAASSQAPVVPPRSDAETDRLRAVPEPTPAVESAGPTAAPVQFSTPDAGFPAVRVFVVDADLGYARLHLDYVVYKPSAPFGSINGQHVAPGSVVSGFRVDGFGEGFVRLSDAKGIVELRAH